MVGFVRLVRSVGTARIVSADTPLMQGFCSGVVRGQQELQQFRDHFAGLLQTVAAKEGVCEPLVEDGFPEWIDIHPRAQIHEILTSMPERDRRIMELRFGLTDSRQPQTLEQLGAFRTLEREGTPVNSSRLRTGA